jgi:multidrug resistance efflux pump
VVTIKTATAGVGDPTAEAVQEHPKSKAAPRLGLILLVVLGLLVAWYALADRHTPYVGTATMSAYVAQIAPRVSGPVVEVLVDDNARVEAGQPLFRIDPRTYELDVVQAEARLAQAAQGLGVSSSGVAAAQARLADARARLDNTRTAVARTMELVERGTYAKARADQAEADLKTAEAAVGAAEAEVEQATRQLGPQGAANPQIQEATAALERARFNLVNTAVVAPAEGFITNLLLTVGQYANTGQALMTFIDPQSPWIIANFRENQLENIDPGDPVEVVFEVDPGQVYEARVESMAWGINAGQFNSGLAQPVADTRWFSPARRIPVRIELLPGTDPRRSCGSARRPALWSMRRATAVLWSGLRRH